MKIAVLGAAAGGGVPQWNCNCRICRSARADDGSVQPSTQASLAVSGDGEHWFLINASPDLRQQIAATPALHPKVGLRHSPICGVILTNGEVDAIAGLLNLRESSPFTIHAHAGVLDVLRANSIFDVLHPDLVRRERIEIEKPFDLMLPNGCTSGLQVTAFTVPGKEPLYLEGTAAGSMSDQTLGLHVRHLGSGADFFCITACAAITPQLLERLDGTRLLLFDGTLWRDDEMIRTGLSSKTGRRMGHVSMSGPHGAIAALASLRVGRRLFLHVNNSNPVLVAGSPERAQLENAGWELAQDGMEIDL